MAVDYQFSLWSSTEGSNSEAKFLEFLQSLGISPGVIHGIVRVLRDTVFLSFICLRGVLDQAGVQIANTPTGKAEGVSGLSSLSFISKSFRAMRVVTWHFW